MCDIHIRIYMIKYAKVCAFWYFFFLNVVHFILKRLEVTGSILLCLPGGCH